MYDYSRLGVLVVCGMEGWVGRLLTVFDRVRNVTWKFSLVPVPVSTVVRDFSWQFYSNVWDQNRLQKTLGGNCMIGWKRTFKIIFNLLFSTGSCLEPTCSETCFIHCVVGSCRVFICLMLASVNQIYVCWIRFPSALICFTGEWVY